jgi:NAD(P)-dependent dehydrogenase (short-subunit alcohol dehydrogenase family)
MKKIIVTGANRGIGLELCRQLAARGEAVTALCRRSSAELAALDVRVIEGLDVGNPVSLDRLSAQLAEPVYDWLINNAGILVRDTLDAPDFEGMERQFRINSMGPLRVTAALLPKLAKGSKVGIITSRMGSIEDNTSGGYYGYRMSKAAVNIAGKSLSIDLAERGIAVGILHPGMVATDMTGGNGVPVEHAASGLIERMEQLTAQNSGTFWHAEGEVLPW